MPNTIYLITQGISEDSGPIAYANSQAEAEAICAEHNTKLLLAHGDMDREAYCMEPMEPMSPSTESLSRETGNLYSVRLFYVQDESLRPTPAPGCELVTPGGVFLDVPPIVTFDEILDEPAQLRCVELFLPAASPQDAIAKAKSFVEKKNEEE